MTTARTVSSIGGAAIVGAAIGAGAMRAAAPTPATSPTVERSEPAARAEWVVGDSNGDGVVSFDDINATTANWGATGPAWPLRSARSVHALRQESIDQPERCVILCDAPQAAIVAALPAARSGGARFLERYAPADHLSPGVQLLAEAVSAAPDPDAAAFALLDAFTRAAGSD